MYINIRCFLKTEQKNIISCMERCFSSCKEHYQAFLPTKLVLEQKL
jgi:hypothetical protein